MSQCKPDSFTAAELLELEPSAKMHRAADLLVEEDRA
jgi:hypothetical protein